MLREHFPTAHQAVTKAAPSEADLVRKITAVIDGVDGAKALMYKLEQLPSVQRHGLSKILAGDLKADLGDLTERLGYLMRIHDGHFAGGTTGDEAIDTDTDPEIEDDLPLDVAV